MSDISRRHASSAGSSAASSSTGSLTPSPQSGRRQSSFFVRVRSVLGFKPKDPAPALAEPELVGDEHRAGGSEPDERRAAFDRLTAELEACRNELRIARGNESQLTTWLEDQNRAAAAAAQEQQDEIFRLLGVVKQLEVEASQLFSDRKQLKQTAHSREQQLRDEFEAQREQLQRSVRELEGSVELKTKTAQRLEAELAERQRQERDAVDARQQLQAAVDELQRALEAERAASAERAAQLEQALQRQRADADQRLRAADSQAAELRNANETLGRALADEQSKLRQLDEQLQAERARRVASEEKASKTSNAELLLAKLVELQSKVGQTGQALADKLDSTSQRINSLDAQQHSARLKAAEQRAAKLQTDYCAFLDQFEETLLECEDL